MPLTPRPSLRTICTAIGVALTASPLASHAQTSRLYLRDGNGTGRTYVVQHGVVLTTIAPAPGAFADYGLAVGTTIHTLPASFGARGQEYALDGTRIGTAYGTTTPFDYY